MGKQESEDTKQEQELKKLLSSYSVEIIRETVTRLLEIVKDPESKPSDVVNASSALHVIVLKKLIADQKVSKIAESSNGILG